VPTKEPAFVERNAVVDKKKVTNTLAWQPVFELINLFVKCNESFFGFFVEFFPSVSPNSLPIAEIQAD